MDSKMEFKSYFENVERHLSVLYGISLNGTQYLLWETANLNVIEYMVLNFDRVLATKYSHKEIEKMKFDGPAAHILEAISALRKETVTNYKTNIVVKALINYIKTGISSLQEIENDYWKGIL